MEALTSLEKGIQRSVREFATGEFDRETLMDMARERVFPEALLNQASELGLMAVALPEAFQGGGLGKAAQAVVLEALASADSTAACALASRSFGVDVLSRFGTDQLKDDVLVGIADGKQHCALALYEQPVQSLPLALQTVAEKVDGGWRITGSKRYVAGAEMAHFVVVLCAKEAGGEPDSLFVVDTSLEGVSVAAPETRLGVTMGSVSTVSLDGVVVQESALLGSAGKGEAVLNALQASLWVEVAALAVGIGASSLAKAVAYIKKRKQFGKRIGAYRISRIKVAQMVSSLEMARLATRQAAQLLDGGKGGLYESALARRVATQAAVSISDEAIQLLGGYGYMAEYDVERCLRDAKVLELMGGEKGLLSEVIADHALGKRRG